MAVGIDGVISEALDRTRIVAAKNGPVASENGMGGLSDGVGRPISFQSSNVMYCIISRIIALLPDFIMNIACVTFNMWEHRTAILTAR